jgi:hypothetical protein
MLSVRACASEKEMMLAYKRKNEKEGRSVLLLNFEYITLNPRRPSKIN